MPAANCARLAEFVAQKWGVDSGAVRFVADGVEADTADGLQRWTFDDLAHKAWFGRVSLSAQGFIARQRFTGT